MGPKDKPQLTLCARCSLPFDTNKGPVCPNCKGEGLQSPAILERQELERAVAEEPRGETLAGVALVAGVVVAMAVGAAGIARARPLGGNALVGAGLAVGVLLAIPVGHAFAKTYGRKASAKIALDGDRYDRLAAMQFGCLGAPLFVMLRLAMATQVGFAIIITLFTSIGTGALATALLLTVNGSAQGDDEPLPCVVDSIAKVDGELTTVLATCTTDGEAQSDRFVVASSPSVGEGARFRKAARRGSLGVWVVGDEPEQWDPVPGESKKGAKR